jgi:hypothetical protein
MQNIVATNNCDFFDAVSQEDELMQDFDRFLTANQANVINEMDEFEQYLADPLLPRSHSEPFDVLAWWKENTPRYPSVSSMARDILAVPITSVASEAVSKTQIKHKRIYDFSQQFFLNQQYNLIIQIFSTAGRIIDDYRSNLNPETVEMLICGQDWLRGAKERGWTS